MPDPLIASLTNVTDLLLDAICVVDEQGCYVYVSAAFEQIFGYAPHEVIGRKMIELVHPDDRERTLNAARNVMAGKSHLHFENRYIRRDGSVVHIMWSARWSETDRLRIAVARDISAIKHAEALKDAVFAISEAANSPTSLQGMLKQIHKSINTLMPADNLAIALWNTGQCPSIPYNAEADTASDTENQATEAFAAAIIDHDNPVLVSPSIVSDLPAVRDAIAGSSAICWIGVPFHSNAAQRGALVLKGYSDNCHYSIHHREILEYVSTQVATAVERKQLYERLQYLAQYDDLTDLPNRTLLQDRLEHAIAKAAREGTSLAVMFVDLDQFKHINDTMGHASGDLLLQQVATRLKSCVRMSDTVGRLSGDEFIIILENIHSDSLAADTLAITGKIQSAFGVAYQLGSDQVQITASIGTACYPQHGTSARQLFKHADAAMYRSKKQQTEPDAQIVEQTLVKTSSR